MLYLCLDLVCRVQFGFSSRYETNYKRVLTYDVRVRSEVVIQCGCQNVETHLLPITHSSCINQYVSQCHQIVPRCNVTFARATMQTVSSLPEKTRVSGAQNLPNFRVE